MHTLTHRIVRPALPHAFATGRTLSDRNDNHDNHDQDGVDCCNSPFNHASLDSPFDIHWSNREEQGRGFQSANRPTGRGVCMLPPPKPPASGTANSRTNSNHTSNSIGSNPLGSTSSAAAPGAAFYTRPPLPARSSASSASTSTQTSYNSSNASSPSVGGTPGTSSGLVSASASGQWGQSGAGSTGAGSWTRVAGYPAPVGSEGEYLELSAAGPSRGRDGPPRPSRVDGGYGSGVHVMGGMFAGKTMR